jgi:hypothetical protein
MVEKLSAQKSEGLARQQQYKGKDAVLRERNGSFYLGAKITRWTPFSWYFLYGLWI